MQLFYSPRPHVQQHSEFPQSTGAFSNARRYNRLWGARIVEMKINARWHGQRKFVAEGASDYAVTIDAKPEAGGTGAGARPMELLLMGLAGCTGIDVTMILERMREPLEGLDIEVSGARREEYPQAFTEIHVTYRMTGPLTAAKVWRAIHLSEEKYCSASASLVAVIVPHLVLNGESLPDTTANGVSDASEQVAD